MIALLAWLTISTAQYDAIWAVSDVHGHREQLERLLDAARLVRDGKWIARRQLLVVVGDSIDGGPDSRGVVFLLESLQEQAPAFESRVVVLLGNHEADYLASRGRETEFRAYLRTMPQAAVVGTWLFAHAGYIDDILYAHKWWKKPDRRRHMRKQLAKLGLDGVVMGHDPDDAIEFDDGWLIRIDTGMKSGAPGAMLRCDAAMRCRAMTVADFGGAVEQTGVSR